MTIYVDADACPVVRIVEKIAREKQIPCVLLCDVNHILESDYSTIKTVDAGPDSVDFALINLCQAGDLVVTQDYGVAAMALGKNAFAIHQSGKWYTNDNIEMLLMERHISKKNRMSNKKHHSHGMPKRTLEDDVNFEDSFRKVIDKT